MFKIKSREEMERGKIAEAKKIEEDNLRHKALNEKVKKYALTISAADYAASKRKSLSSYEFVSVENCSLEELVDVGEKLGAEVITDIKPYTGPLSFHYIGTALIPKNPEEK